MPVYKDKENPGKWFYQVNYKNKEGKYVSTKKRGFNTKREAQDAEYQKRLDLDKTDKTDISFKDLYFYFFESIKMDDKYSSYVTMRGSCDIHILPYFGKRKAEDITVNDIIAWKKEMESKDLSFNHISKQFTNLSAIFNYGIKFNGLKNNPCRTVGNFKNREIKKGPDFWTFENFQDFIRAVDKTEYLVLFSLLYYTGARVGEAQALTWMDIDFDSQDMYIFKTYSEKVDKPKGADHWDITKPKTVYSIRHVLMPKVLIDLLKGYYKECQNSEGFTDESFIFGGSRPKAHSSVRFQFVKYLKYSGAKPIRIHDLRHSHASLLINLGANILVVSKRLGHKDVNRTLNTYSHMFPNKQAETVQIIDNLAVSCQNRAESQLAL